MLRSLSVASLGLVVVLLFAAGVQAQPAADEDPSVEEIYLKHCASCHGKQMQGGNAQSMVDGVWRFGRRNGELFRNIKFGISSAGMPDYQNAFSDQQIGQLVKYIRDAESNADFEPPELPEKLQTRDYDVGVEKWITEGLEVPWAMEFIDEKTALLTERPGRLRWVENGKLHPDPIRGTPEVHADGQGGLMDVALDPNYAENGWVYLSFSHAQEQANEQGATVSMTRVVRGKIRDHQWVDQQLLYTAPESSYLNTTVHFGCRIAFDREGLLYFSIGDRGTGEHAQQLDRPNGKIHRLRPDGTIPSDNPFVGTEGALESIFSYGHRNPQGLATHPVTGRIWETEHGPMGGDETNLLAAGKNYGWPEISYGINYDGTSVTDKTSAQGMQQPVLYWVPSIAVCGIDFCRGREFPRWRNNLLVTGLSYEEVRRLVVSRNRVIHEEVLLKGAGRVRDVTCSPSGEIYVLLNTPDIVVRLTNDGRAMRQ